MTSFWLNDLSILFSQKYFFEITPDKSFDSDRKLNAIFRFSLYFSMLSFGIYKNNSVFMFPLVVMIVTIILHNYSKKKIIDSKSDSKSDKVSCVKPELNNPFMNLNMYDINKTTNKACYSYDNPEIKSNIKEIFDDGLYKDAGDIYNNNNSQSRFYTMPNTLPANNQTKFANWLYKTPPTCKEGNGYQCSANVFDMMPRYSTGGTSKSSSKSS